MTDIKHFSVAEDYDYQALLNEAIETILTANAELGPGDRQTDEAVQTAVAPLRKLKTAQALFAPTLTVQPLTRRSFTARGLEPAPNLSDWLRTHRFYLIQVPVTLQPAAAGWAFTRLEVWVGFAPAGPNAPAANPLKVHDLYPEDVWTEIVKLETHLNLGLGESLKFQAGLDQVDLAYQKLSGQAQAKVGLDVEAGAHLVIGPFNYAVSRPQVTGRGLENAEVFWTLDGQQHVQREEPYLAVVLRVPQDLEEVAAASELIAYQQFDFAAANLKDWADDFRPKLKSFFGTGIPLRQTAAWSNITAE